VPETRRLEGPGSPLDPAADEVVERSGTLVAGAVALPGCP